MTEEGFEKWLGEEAHILYDQEYHYDVEAVHVDSVRALFARLKAEREWVAVAENSRPEEKWDRIVVSGEHRSAVLWFDVTEGDWRNAESGWSQNLSDFQFMMPLPPLPGAEDK